MTEQRKLEVGDVFTTRRLSVGREPNPQTCWLVVKTEDHRTSCVNLSTLCPGSCGPFAEAGFTVLGKFNDLDSNLKEDYNEMVCNLPQD